MKNTWKRMIAMILAMVMSLSLLSANVWAADTFAKHNTLSAEETYAGTRNDNQTLQTMGYDEEDDNENTNGTESGKCGERLTWEYNWLTGVLTIQGSGAMNNWDELNDAPWAYLRDDIISVVIQNGVTSIGNRAFYECYQLNRVSIGNDVTIIGDDSFAECWILNNIELPGSILHIGTRAFSDCKQLKKINIPNNVATIGDFAFADCICLPGFIIPDSVTGIGEGVFSGCKNMTSVTIGNHVACIPQGMFSGCERLTTVNLSNGVTRIDEWAFADCLAFSRIDIPGSVITIGDYAYEGCAQLKSITIPRSVTKIGMGALGYIFGKTGDTPISGFSLKGYIGSAAEAYAKENNIPFTALNSDTKTPGTISVKTTIFKTSNVKKNQTFNLGASANGAHISYKTSNKKVAVSKTGKVTIKKGFVGNVTITITLNYSPKPANCSKAPHSSGVCAKI